jgi:hypothetical protein
VVPTSPVVENPIENKDQGQEDKKSRECELYYWMETFKEIEPASGAYE